MSFVYVAIGSAIGGVARYGIATWISTWTANWLPWGTVAVNVTGSFAIGALLALTEPSSRFVLGGTGRDFLMVGVLGGYTTFSAFSLQTFELLRTQQWLQAGSNVLLSVTLCLLAVWVGHSAIASVAHGAHH